MSNASEIEQKLSALSSKVLDEVSANGTLQQRIDAIKAIGTLHLGLTKLSAKNGAEEPEGGMAAMRDRIRAAGNGEGK